MIERSYLLICLIGSLIRDGVQCQSIDQTTWKHFNRREPSKTNQHSLSSTGDCENKHILSSQFRYDKLWDEYTMLLVERYFAALVKVYFIVCYFSLNIPGIQYIGNTRN